MSRSAARDIAFKVLFQIDLVGGESEKVLEDLLDYSLEEGVEVLQEQHRAFASDLVYNTLRHLDVIDACISRFSPEWSIDRMAVADRNLMRLAVAEMLYTDIDSIIAIDEAVEMAKKYGDVDSKGFINAILDKIMEECTDEPGSRN